MVMLCVPHGTVDGRALYSVFVYTIAITVTSTLCMYRRSVFAFKFSLHIIAALHLCTFQLSILSSALCLLVLLSEKPRPHMIG